MAASDPSDRDLIIYQRFKPRWQTLSWEELDQIKRGYPETLIPPDGKTINTYLPIELFRAVFLYCIEVNQMKSIQLAFVCGQWRSVITTMSHLWSTLRVGSWTEREQVTTWLQRAYPKKVVIDTERYGQGKSDTPRFSALQDALTTTGQWHELTISSFPLDNLSSQLGFQTAGPMNVLNVLHVAAGCPNSPHFTHLLDLVPPESPISEMRLYSSFAITYFLQPHRFPVMQKLTVLIVNGRDIDTPFELLPAFTQLQIFEADQLPLPWYEPDVKLPLLDTLQKLQLKGSSVQWMAGREFRRLTECVILFPLHWVAWKQHGVQLPSCIRLTYRGYPMTTVQYLHVPHMKVLGLGSNDCKGQRVYQHLQHLCTLDQTIFRLTALHLTLQCSEQVFVKVLKYLGPLQELVLSTAYHSVSWQCFLQSLAAVPSTRDWPQWYQGGQWDQWDQWCSSQTWHVDVLPCLKYLGIQCPKGFSQSECLGHCPLFRFIAWTRSQSTSPLEHLEVWEGRGTAEDIMVDYMSSSYLKKHLGTLNEKCDSKIVKGMVTQSLVIDDLVPPFMYQLHLTALFRQLQSLTVFVGHDVEIWILPDLEQIKRLNIQWGIIPSYSANTELPLVNTLQWLDIHFSTFSWMFGRTFKALEKCTFSHLKTHTADISVYNGQQVDLSACRSLNWAGGYETSCYFSHPNVQFLQWEPSEYDYALLEAAPESLPGLLLNSSCLQQLEVTLSHYVGLVPLTHLIFCDSLEHGVWQNIRSVEMKVHCDEEGDKGQFFDQIVGNQRLYMEGWKEFVVSKEEDDFDFYSYVTVRASCE